MSRILSKDFRYVNAASTNIARTFRRIRAEQKAKREQEERNEAEAQRVVAPILPRIKGKVSA